MYFKSLSLISIKNTSGADVNQLMAKAINGARETRFTATAV